MPQKTEEAATMAVLQTKLPAKTAEAFRRYADERGVPVSRLLSDFIRQTLAGSDKEGEQKMVEATVGKAKTVVTYSIWETTAEAMLRVAKESRVPVDELVNGVLCEFLSKFGR